MYEGKDSLIFLIHLLFYVMKAKEISSDDSGSTIVLTEDVERPDRASAIGSTRPWTDLPSKLPVCKLFVLAFFIFILFFSVSFFFLY